MKGGLLASVSSSVALRKESVDRNCYLDNIEIAQAKSLSARRAWIEMDVTAKTGLFTSSLSARRAWIEMAELRVFQVDKEVALRKESVDRNSLGTNTILSITGRSPQGERG